jgi:hypothetical protein
MGKIGANLSLTDKIVLLLLLKPIQTMKTNTCIFTLKISEVQKATLDKLRSKKIKVSQFVRDAISEKIQREYLQLIEKPKEKAPF